MKNYTPEQTAIMTRLQSHYRFGEWNAQFAIDQDFRCAYCDLDFLSTFNNYNSWTWDHIVPLSRFGADDLHNIIVCCKTCNWLKGTHMPEGASREELVASSRTFVQQQRAAYEAEVDEVRAFGRGTAVTA